MTLTIYDITIDGTREVTQQDIDRLMATEQAYGKLRTALTQIHTDLMIEIGRVRLRDRPVIEIPSEPDGVAGGEQG